MADRYGIARRPAARESRVRFTLAFLCLILLLSVPGLVAAAGETTDPASHQHLWKQTGSLGESRYFSCETCGEKRTVQIHTSYGAQGSYLISPYDGRGGAPADLAFSVDTDAEDSAVSYRWFTCQEEDAEQRVPISGAEASEYRTESFPGPEIRSYVCEADVRYALEGQFFSETILSEIFHAAWTGLPTVYIDTETETEFIPRDEYTDASFRLVPGSSDPGDEIRDTIRIKGRGNFTWTLPRKGYNLKFGSKTDLLGMGKAKKWSLISNHADKTLLRNWYASYLASEVFSSRDWTPRYHFVDVILNGAYMGNYCLVSPITVSKSRINIQPLDEIKEDMDRDGRLTLSDGGFILEVNARKDAAVNFVTEKKLNLSFHDPDLEDAAPEVITAVQERIQALEDMLWSKKTAKSEGLVEQYLDLETWINGYLIYELGRNPDAAYFSVFFYFDPSELLFHLGPIWDFDTSFGNGNSDFEPEGFGLKKAKWIRPLFNYPAFVSALKEKWQSAREKLAASVQQALPEQAERIRISASLNNLCWPVSDRYGLTTPAGYEERFTWQDELDYLTQWLTTRMSWMDQAIDGL